MTVFSQVAQVGLVFKVSVSVSVSFRGGTLGGGAVAVGRLCIFSLLVLEYIGETPNWKTATNEITFGESLCLAPLQIVGRGNAKLKDGNERGLANPCVAAVVKGERSYDVTSSGPVELYDVTARAGRGDVIIGGLVHKSDTFDSRERGARAVPCAANRMAADGRGVSRAPDRWAAAACASCTRTRQVRAL